MTNQYNVQSKGTKVRYASANRESLSGCFKKVRETTQNRPVELRGPFLKTQNQAS